LLMVTTGFVVGGSGAVPAVSSGATSASIGAAHVTAPTFNFSNPSPTWNAGNLCVPTTVGGNEYCVYSGSTHHGFSPTTAGTTPGCGCQGSTPLTYNFSSRTLDFTVNISNLNNRNVYLNFQGATQNITINVNGCQGGTLTVSIKGEETVNLHLSTSSLKALIYIYGNHDTYNAWISNDHNSVSTYFVSAQWKVNECPALNNSWTDAYSVSMSGFSNSQGIAFVNAVGPTSTLNGISTGHWNSMWFENTTTFTCSWTFAPASTCSHGYTVAEVLAAVRQKE
jgi:hypothetical protein